VKDQETPPIEVNGGQGVQVGSGNVQNNMWHMKPPPDLASLSALNPHVAVARLQRLSHEDLVDLFARASPADATDMLLAFLETDAATVVAILGDIRRRQSSELIKSIVTSSNMLASLPEASEVIAHKAVALKWAHDGVLERVSKQDGPGYGGYSRGYRNGRLFWHDEHGVGAVSGVIETYRASNDWLGFPVGEQEAAPSSPFGTDGIQQAFSDGTVYTSERGIFCVRGGFITCLEAEGGTAGWLGFPVAEIRGSVGNGWTQRFEGGLIFFCFIEGGSETYAARTNIMKALTDMTFWPISKGTVTESSFGSSGMFQRFEVGEGSDENAYETAVCWPENHDSIMVEPEVWSYYEQLGRAGSWLGFPTNPVLHDKSGARVQRFEGGAIYWRPGTGPISVRGDVLEMMLDDPTCYGKIGYPVSEERSIGPGESDRIQFFDNGNVTLRAGKREAWLRLEPSKPSNPTRKGLHPLQGLHPSSSQETADRDGRPYPRDERLPPT
jgi:hypothetical protein